MRSFKIDEYTSIPFKDEVETLRENGEHKEGFDLMDSLLEQSITTNGGDEEDKEQE